MDGKTLARLAAVIFVAFALTATAIEITREEEPEMPATATVEAGDGRSVTFRSELSRCQQLGEAATGDPVCLRVWAENRRRFLGIEDEPSVRLPGAAAVPGVEAR